MFVIRSTTGTCQNNHKVKSANQCWHQASVFFSISSWRETLIGGFHFMIFCARADAFKSYNIFLHGEVGFARLGPRCFFRKAPKQVLESIWTCRPKLAKWSRRVFEASLQTCALCFCSLASTRMAQEWAWVCMRTDDPTQLLKEVLLSKIFWNHLPMVVAPPANQEGVLSVLMLTIC